MRYNVLLFDADGTLYDFERAEAFALKESFKELGVEFSPRHLSAYEEVNRQVWQLFEQGEITSDRLRIMRFERFQEKVGIDADPGRMSRSYLSWLARASFLLDGARELIEALSGSCRLAIVTNGLKDVQRGRFARSPIRGCFDAIVISEEVGVQKPDPAIFAYALQQLEHSDKGSVLMVGDSLTSDIQGGVNFGIDTCWFNPAGAALPDRPVPTHNVRDFEQLRELCLSGGDG